MPTQIEVIEAHALQWKPRAFSFGASLFIEEEWTMKFSRNGLMGGWMSAAALFGVMAFAAPSSAVPYSVTQPYQDCLAELGDAGDYVSGGSTITSANTLIVSCPITDSTDLAHKDMTTVQLYYQDNTTTGSVFSFRCVEYYNATGGSCGDSASSSSAGTGIGHLDPPNTPAGFATDWNSTLHFAYMMVFLPPKTGGGAISKVKGIFTAK